MRLALLVKVSITKLSPSPSLRWAELVIFQLIQPPTHPPGQVQIESLEQYFEK